MKVYTSYFANWRKFPKDITVLGVTRFPIAREQFPNDKRFAPSDRLVLAYKHGDINQEEFTKKYIEELHMRGFNSGEDIAAALEKISGGKDILLCCFEKKGSFCHRRILAKLLEPVVGPVEEL